MTRMTRKNLILASTIALAVAATGCDVEQTREGEMPEVDVSAEAGQLPEYEVVQTQEGEMPDVDMTTESGTMPQYSVDWMDVDVGMTEETVTVPKVRVVMEEEVVSVPVIDVTMPDADERPKERRTLELEAQVPHGGHDLSIHKVYALENRILVVGELVESDEDAESQTVSVADRVVLNAPDLNVRYYLMGVEPMRMESSDFTYIVSEDSIPADLDSAVELYNDSPNSNS